VLDSELAERSPCSRFSLTKQRERACSSLSRDLWRVVDPLPGPAALTRALGPVVRVT
jgi:hypothetical protein